MEPNFPSHPFLFSTWGSLAVDRNDDAKMHVNPALLVQIRKNHAILTVVILVRFRQEFLHWHYRQKVNTVDAISDEYGLIILNRDT